jgi:hypothetical protein
MSATIRIHRVFPLTGRSPVVLAELLTGEVRAGAWIVAVRGPAFRIGAVETAHGGDLPPATLGLVLRDAPSYADAAERLPVGTTLVVAEPLGTPQAVAAGVACHRGLRRYWFPLSSGLGIGVTAASDAEANAWAAEAQQRIAPGATLLAPIADVDVRTLDPGHVQPNIGPVVVRGVWFPLENL